MAFDPTIYAQIRPDLLVNWQRAQDPAWANDPNIAFIKSFPSLEAYLQADYQNDPAGNDARIASAVQQSAGRGTGGTTTTPTPTVTPQPQPQPTPTPTTGQTGATPQAYTLDQIREMREALGLGTSAGGASGAQAGTGAGTGTQTGGARLPTYGELLTRYQMMNPGVDVTAPGFGDTFNAWAGSVAPNGWDPSFSGYVPVPTQEQTDRRDLGAEAYNTLASQIQLAGPAYDAYAQYAGRYGQTDLANAWNLLQGPGGQMGLLALNRLLTDEANAQTVGSNTALRLGNVFDASTLGPAGLEAMRASNPELYAALERSSQMSQAGMPRNEYQVGLGATFAGGPDYRGVSPSMIQGVQQVSQPDNPLLQFASGQATQQGQTGLGMDLTAMAREQLALGSSLSDQQKREATQAAREGWSARGLINSPGAVAEEVLNRDAYGRQLLNERQNFASSVNQLEQAQRGQNNQYMLGVLGQTGTQGAQNLQSQLANQAAGLDVSRLNQAAVMQADMANQGADLTARQQNQALGLGLASMDYGRNQQAYQNLLADAGLQSANKFDPFATITSAGSANQGVNPALFGMGASGASGALGMGNVQSMFNPYNAYAGDVYNTNVNANLAQQLSQQNNRAATQGSWIQGGLGLAGGILGSFLGPVGTAVGSAAGNWIGGKIG